MDMDGAEEKLAVQVGHVNRVKINNLKSEFAKIHNC